MGKYSRSVLDHYNYIPRNGKIVDTIDHLPFLREKAVGNVLEIGVDVGNTTTALLLGLEEKGGHLYSVDIRDLHDVWEGHPQWTFIQDDTTDPRAQETLAEVLPELDVAYVDGSHTYEAAKSDIEFCLSKVKAGGLVLVHDVELPVFPGVRQAFDEVQLEKEIRHNSWGLGVIYT